MCNQMGAVVAKWGIHLESPIKMPSDTASVHLENSIVFPPLLSLLHPSNLDGHFFKCILVKFVFVWVCSFLLLQPVDIT